MHVEICKCQHINRGESHYHHQVRNERVHLIYDVKSNYKLVTYLYVFIAPSEANLPPAGTSDRRIVYSSDEEDDAPVRRGPFDRPPTAINKDDDEVSPILAAVTRYRKAARRNPFIEMEAGVDGHASADEDDGEVVDLDGFIAANNVY